MTSKREAALWISIGLNGGFAVIELIGGLAFGSLALVADSAHMGSDVGALGLALVAAKLSSRPSTDRHSFGFRRAEILGAQVNSVLLIFISAWISIEAINRASLIPEIKGSGVVAIALVGLAINAFSALILARAAGSSLNMHGAVWHMLSDALGSVAALASGVAVVFWDARWVDVAASFAVAALVTIGAVGVLIKAVRILLEATPSGLDPKSVLAHIAAIPGVESVHHLHIWSLDSETLALSVHVVLSGEPTLHDAQTATTEIRQSLFTEFGVDHATIEVECHPCE